MNAEVLAGIQGAFYFATGIWPLVHLQSFLKVTGPKTDIWLLNTVSVLILSMSVVLLHAAFSGEVPFAVRLLAVSGAAALAAIDLRYAIPGRIRRIYLVDAVAEILLILLWIVTGLR